MLFSQLRDMGESEYVAGEDDLFGLQPFSAGQSTYAMALDQQTTLGLDAGLIEVIGTAVWEEDFGAAAGVLQDALPKARTINLVRRAPGDPWDALFHARAVDLVSPAHRRACGIGLHNQHANDAGHQPKTFP